MKLRSLLIINAIIALVYGISFELIPAKVLSIYGVTQGPAESLMGQYFGVALIAIGLLAWLARDVTDSKAQHAIILAMLISNVIGVIVSVLGHNFWRDERSRLDGSRNLPIVGVGLCLFSIHKAR